MRLSIDEYANRFELPIATVHTKLRNKELEYSIDNGVVYILLSNIPDPRQKTSVGTIIALYQKENQHLKERVKELENKIDGLISDKEQMLREERSRIEHLYQSKDEQLKTVLELINTKLQLSQPTAIKSVDEDISSVDVELEEEDEMQTEQESQHRDNSNPHKVSLRQYLKNIGLEAQEKRVIKRRFAGAYGSDIRILQYHGEFYLDLSKFDYSDLLKIH
ncbi:MAG: hypothetical protein PF439_03495 [Helicobacteraceae bacterium]|jgi:exonuclease VII large subunit|nr:hypothetical protein [Helicobacteraceae bacterium]